MNSVPVHVSRIIVVTSLLICILSACDESPSDRKTHGVTTALQRIDSLKIRETNDRFIGTLTDLDVRLDPFRLYIADRKMHRVAVVGRDGALRQFIGRPGKGPGELQNPVHVLATEDRIVVNQARRRGYSVFDTSGAHMDAHRLPEVYWYGGFYDFYADGNGGYVLPLSKGSESTGLQASPDEATVSRLNADFEVVETFGRFPALYQEGEYTARQRTLDITTDSLAAVSYALVPVVQVYDLGNDGAPKIEEVSFDPPTFQEPEQEIPRSLALESPDETRKALSRVSTVRNTYLLDDGTVVLHYSNETLAYYKNQFDKDEQTHYAVLGSLNSDRRTVLKLPGPILDRDRKDRLYIELSHEPDNRKIGIYKVDWP